MNTVPAEVTGKALAVTPDVISMLLDDKRSENTRRAYRRDLEHFFGHTPEQSEVARFLAQDQHSIAVSLNTYKARMINSRLSEATVNRRLAAVRSLIKYGRRLGLCTVDATGLVDNEKAKAYRDTSGIDIDSMRRLLDEPNTRTLKGKRNISLLLLLSENGLRRAEICRLDVSDFHPVDRRLTILGKGRGSQSEAVTLSDRAVSAIFDYLQASDRSATSSGALFLSLDHRQPGRLTPDGLLRIVINCGIRAGISKRLSPHRIRHSAITAALDATGGDVRSVQKLSRHAKLETLMIYDDNRRDAQGDVTNMLSKLFSSE